MNVPGQLDILERIVLFAQGQTHLGGDGPKRPRRHSPLAEIVLKGLHHYRRIDTLPTEIWSKTGFFHRSKPLIEKTEIESNVVAAGRESSGGIIYVHVAQQDSLKPVKGLLSRWITSNLRGRDSVYLPGHRVELSLRVHWEVEALGDLPVHFHHPGNLNDPMSSFIETRRLYVYPQYVHALLRRIFSHFEGPGGQVAASHRSASRLILRR